MWLYSQVDSRTCNGEQSPGSDVVNTWICGSRGHDPDLKKSRFSNYTKKTGSLCNNSYYKDNTSDREETQLLIFCWKLGK